MATLSDLLSQAAYTPPARPYTPTPIPSDIMTALYGNPAPPQPLPSYLPQNVQNYIRNAPSYGEGHAQGQWPDVGEPGQPPDPQAADVHRLFHDRIKQNSPSNFPSGLNAQQLRTLMQAPGFSGFTGGTSI